MFRSKLQKYTDDAHYSFVAFQMHRDLFRHIDLGVRLSVAILSGISIACLKSGTGGPWIWINTFLTIVGTAVVPALKRMYRLDDYAMECERWRNIWSEYRELQTAFHHNPDVAVFQKDFERLWRKDHGAERQGEPPSKFEYLEKKALERVRKEIGIKIEK